MASDTLTVDEVLALLSEQPRRIATLTSGVPAALLRTPPAPDEWSANEVLAHLRSCGDVWGDCIARILAEDRPTLRAVSPRTWITRTNYLDLEFGPSLRAYRAQRDRLLADLRALKPDDWARGATVTGVGRTVERTVLSYADWLARHERPHVKQVEHIVTTVVAA
jgi:DinB superfamily